MQLKSPTDIDNYLWPADELARFNAYMSGSEPLWEPPKAEPPDRNDADARKVFWVAAVNAWIANGRRQPDAHMSLQDIKASQDRFLVQRVLLDSVVAACRAFPTADRVLAVLICDILFAEASSHKYSDVSAERLGHLLSCGERAVRMARERLVEYGIMAQEKRPGLTNKHWPVINPDFAGQDLHPTWWLDATSDAPAPRGKPAKPRIDDPGVKTDNPGSVTPTLYDNPGSVRPKPRIGDADEFSTVRYEEKKRDLSEGVATRKRGGPTQEEVDAGFTEWWAHYPRKADKPDAKKAYTAIVTGRHKNPECRATMPQLLAGLKAYRFPKDPDYIRLPATWLNKGSWASGAADARGADSLEARVDLALASERGRELIREKGPAEARAYIRSVYSSPESSTAGGQSVN